MAWKILMIDLDQKQQEVKKRNTYKSAYALCEGWELTLNAFRKWIFPIKTQGKELIMLIST